MGLKTLEFEKTTIFIISHPTDSVLFVIARSETKLDGPKGVKVTLFRGIWPLRWRARLTLVCGSVRNSYSRVSRNLFPHTDQALIILASILHSPWENHMSNPFPGASMKSVLFALLLAFGGSASATVLDFDNLGGDFESIPFGYGGFNWDVDTTVGTVNGANATSVSGFPGYANGVRSGANVAFNFGGNAPTTILRSADDLFTFNSAYFTSSVGAQLITLVGLLDDNEVTGMRRSYALTDLAPVLVQLDWAGIDGLRIYSTQQVQWVVDDFTFQAADGSGGDDGGGGDNGTPVPEPLSLSLMGLGLAGIGLARRAKKN
jgi:hypothetical protein